MVDLSCWVREVLKVIVWWVMKRPRVMVGKQQPLTRRFWASRARD